MADLKVALTKEELDTYVDRIVELRKQQDEELPTVDVKEVINVCAQFMLGEIDKEFLDEWCKKIYIKNYLPLSDKISISLGSFLLRESFLEGFRFWFGLLRYTNIKIEPEDEILCNLDSYNICYPILGPWLLTYCGPDYNILNHMIDEYLNLRKMEDLGEALGKLDEEVLGEQIKEMTETLGDLTKNKKVIKDMATILSMNDPSLKKVSDEINASALKESMKK